jgi:hypothetical protein
MSNTTKSNTTNPVSKTRTTYRASTHPKWSHAKWTQANPRPDAVDIPISIIVHPAPTYEELCAMRDESSNNFVHALNLEVNRCKPKPFWMQRANSDPTPTQHACIDPAQVKQLECILRPETLHGTFISIAALMNEIQKDVALLVKW